MLAYFAIASLLTALSHGFFAWRLPSRRWLRRLLVANLLLLPATLVLTLRAPARLAWLAVPAAHLAFTDVGFCLLLLGLLGLAALALGLARLLQRSRAAVDGERRQLLQGSLNWAAVGLAGGATAVGYGLALAQPVLRRQTVPIGAAALPVGWRGLRLLQLSDLHVGPTIRRGYVDALVDTVNRLDADVIVITGDLVDGFVDQLAAQVAPLGRLRARLGVYFVTGNHEYYYRPDEWRAALGGLGIETLNNRHVCLRHGGAQLLLCGVDDPSGGQRTPRERQQLLRTALAGAPAGGLRVLLSHRPSDGELAAAAGFDLQLSGHLHGGQFFPLTLAVAAREPYVAGLYRLGNSWLYVNRGAGYWGPPNRLGMRQELTLLELVAA